MCWPYSLNSAVITSCWYMLYCIVATLASSTSSKYCPWIQLVTLELHLHAPPCWPTDPGTKLNNRKNIRFLSTKENRSTSNFLDAILSWLYNPHSELRLRLSDGSDQIPQNSLWRWPGTHKKVNCLLKKLYTCHTFLGYNYSYQIARYSPRVAMCT